MTLLNKMPFKIASLVILSLVCPACTLAAQALRIMPLGDSLTEGAITRNGVLYSVGAYRKQMVTDVAPHLDFIFVGSRHDRAGTPGYINHEGHGGWNLLNFIGEKTSIQGYPVTDEPAVTYYVKKAEPDIILLDVGTNDNACGLDEFVRRYTKLLTLIYSVAPNVKIVWAETLPKLSDKTGAMFRDSHAAVPLVLKNFPGKTIVVVDPSEGFDPTTMTIDGAHPNDIGEPFLTKAMEKGLQQITGYKS